MLLRAPALVRRGKRLHALWLDAASFMAVALLLLASARTEVATGTSSEASMLTTTRAAGPRGRGSTVARTSMRRAIFCVGMPRLGYQGTDGNAMPALPDSLQP